MRKHRPSRAASTVHEASTASVTGRQIFVLVVRKYDGQWQVLVPLYGQQTKPVYNSIATIERMHKPVITTAAQYASAVLGARLSEDRFVVIFTTPNGPATGVVMCMSELQPDEARISLGHGNPVWWNVDWLLDAGIVGQVMSVWMHELQRYLLTRA